MTKHIEIVREMQLWRRAQGKYGKDKITGEIPYCEMPYSPSQYGEAIDAVLADAEKWQDATLAKKAAK